MTLSAVLREAFLAHPINIFDWAVTGQTEYLLITSGQINMVAPNPHCTLSEERNPVNTNDLDLEFGTLLMWYLNF